MAFKTGRPASIKDLMAGYEKVSKELVVDNPVTIEKVIKGTSAEYGEFIFVLGTIDTKKVYVAVPAASFHVFTEWNEADNELMASGRYLLIMESNTATKSGREYFTCYVDEK